jgi:hypothetical protein
MARNRSKDHSLKTRCNDCEIESLFLLERCVIKGCEHGREYLVTTFQRDKQKFIEAIQQVLFSLEKDSRIKP